MTEGSRRVFLDVTSASSQVMVTGVQRVVRAIGRVLREDPGVDPVFAVWSKAAGSYYRVNPIEEARLERIFEPGIHRSVRWAKVARTWRRRRFYWGWVRRGDAVDPFASGFEEFWIPEIFPDRRVDWLRERMHREERPRAVGFFHDAITLEHPEWTPASRVPGFAGYLEGLALLDLVVAPSETSAGALRRAWKDGREAPIRIEPWPVGIIGMRRNPDLNLERPTILSVGSLEPRKNHLRLLDAAVEVARSGLRFRLMLIGRPVYPYAKEVFAKFREARASGVDLTWAPEVTDAGLASAYAGAWFTVFPSLAEGFGLPVDESLWFGRPCICSGSGAVGERTGRGGCLTVDVERVEAIRDGMMRLLTERETLLRLIRQAQARDFPDWEGLVRRVLLSRG